jgi:hypothetical protein
MTRTGPPVSRGEWEELDLFRGIAALLMVVNHAAVRWQPDARAWSGTVEAFFFLGSFAPVLFFFATGAGSGIQSRSAAPRGHRYGFLNKVVILFCADALLSLGSTEGFRLDFLGFIALSMLVLEPLRAMRRPLPAAAAACAAAAVIRFGLGSSAVLARLPEAVAPGVALLTGARSTPVLSYPPFPWLCLPLAGFLLGHLIAGRRDELHARFGRTCLWLGGAGLACGAATWGLLRSGHVLMRYGTVSVSFFVLSFAVLAAALLLAALASRVDALASLRRWLGLRGVASLSVVPLHFLLILAAGRVASPGADTLSYLAGCAVVSPVVMAGAHATGALAQRARRSADTQTLWWVLAAGAALSAIRVPAMPPSLMVVFGSLGQLLLCILLVLPTPFGARARRPIGEAGRSPREVS